MGFRPLRRAPMMLGGVGFQVGLDEASRKPSAAQDDRARAHVDVVEQLRGLQALLDEGALTLDEFRLAKRKVLAS